MTNPPAVATNTGLGRTPGGSALRKPGTPTTWNGKVVLYLNEKTPDGDSNTRVNTWRHCSDCGDRDGISSRLMKRVEDAVTKAFAYCQPIEPEARRVQINFSAQCITYEGPDGEIHTVSLHKISDPELLALAVEIRELAKPLARFRTSTDSEMIANRGIDGLKPLEVTRQKWAALTQISAENFISAHLPFLASHLTPDQQGEAKRNIRTAAYLIDRTVHHLTDKRDRAKADLARIPLNETNKRRKKQKQIRELDKAIEKFQSIDRFAVYHNAAFLGSNPGGLDLAARLGLGNRSRDAMSGFLAKNAKSIGSPLAAEMNAYAADCGDLFVHDRWDYEDRISGASESAEDRAKRGANLPKRHSAEEFILNNLILLNATNLSETVFLGSQQPPPQFDDLVSSLGVSQASNTAKHTLIQAVLKARAETLAQASQHPKTQHTSHQYLK